MPDLQAAARRALPDTAGSTGRNDPDVRLIADALLFTELWEWGYGPIKDLAVDLAAALRAYGAPLVVPADVLAAMDRTDDD